MKTKKYEIVNTNEIESVGCACGQTKRAFIDDPEKIASLHVVDIQEDSKTHYHKHMTEIYYVLDGIGSIELDGKRYSVEAGTSVMIKPGCRHRAIGQLRIINIPIPAFDPDDEWFD